MKKAKPEVAWAIIGNYGVHHWSISYLRREAIEKAEREFGMTWGEIKRNYRVGKVRIEEA
jgi:hypothetical protein